MRVIMDINAMTNTVIGQLRISGYSKKFVSSSRIFYAMAVTRVREDRND